MEIKKRIGFTYDLRDILLSLQIGFCFVQAAVACAILEGTSGFEPLCEQLLLGIRSVLQYPAHT